MIAPIERKAFQDLHQLGVNDTKPNKNEQR